MALVALAGLLTRVYGHDRFRLHSQHVHPKHPPDQKYRDDTPDDVNDPVASCLRLSKIEHAPMVAGPAYVRCLFSRGCAYFGQPPVPKRPESPRAGRLSPY
jgi:hypothetical protein